MAFPPQQLVRLSRLYWVTRASSVLTGSATGRWVWCLGRRGYISSQGASHHFPLDPNNRYKRQNLETRYNNRYRRRNLETSYNNRYRRRNFSYSWIRIENVRWLHVTVNALNKYNSKFINKLNLLHLKLFGLNPLHFQSGCFRVILPWFGIQSLVCANEQY